MTEPLARDEPNFLDNASYTVARECDALQSLCSVTIQSSLSKHLDLTTGTSTSKTIVAGFFSGHKQDQATSGAPVGLALFRMSKRPDKATRHPPDHEPPSKKARRTANEHELYLSCLRRCGYEEVCGLQRGLITFTEYYCQQCGAELILKARDPWFGDP